MHRTYLSRTAGLGLILSSLALCGGPPLENARLCQKLEGQQCPEGLDMFLRTARRLHISGDPKLDPGETIALAMQYLPEPEKPRNIYKTDFKIPETEGPVAIPMEPGKLQAGSYRVVLGEKGEDPGLMVNFSVWNTQAEIDARRALGDKTGAILTQVFVCKEPTDKRCEESFESFPAETKVFHFSMRYDDAIPGTDVEVQWKQGGRLMDKSKLRLDDGSGIMYGYFGYKDSTFKSGKYSAVITASKSKQGILTKKWRVR